MNHSISAESTSFLVSAILFLLVALGTQAEVKPETDASPNKLRAEIEGLLILDKTGFETDEEGVGAFNRIEDLSRRLVAVGDFETAAALAKKGFDLFPEERRSLCLWGWTEGLAGDYKEAIEITRRALQAEAKSLPDAEGASLKNAETNLAGFLIHEGELREAVRILESASQEQTDRGAIEYLLGEAYFELTENYLSAKAYERALRTAENLATSEDYFRYATALDRMGKLDRAEKALQLGTKNLPNDSGLYLNLGLNAEARGATREAYLNYGMETEVSGPESPFSEAARNRIERIEAVQSKSSFPDAPLGSLIEYFNLREAKKKPENTDKDIDAKIEKAYTTVFAADWTDHPYLKLLQAEHLNSTQGSQAALATLEEARSKFPKQVLFTLELAKVYGEIGDASKSDMLVRDALLQAPEHWKVQRIVGPIGTAP